MPLQKGIQNFCNSGKKIYNSGLVYYWLDAQNVLFFKSYFIQLFSHILLKTYSVFFLFLEFNSEGILIEFPSLFLE